MGVACLAHCISIAYHPRYRELHERSNAYVAPFDCISPPTQRLLGPSYIYPELV